MPGVNNALTFPLPMGVSLATSMAHAPLKASDLAHLPGNFAGAEERSRQARVLGTDSSVIDPSDLQQAGWGIIFAAEADPQIKAALQPLLDLRRSQVTPRVQRPGAPELFKIFEGSFGVARGQSAREWAAARGVSLTAPVRPRVGVPYYLLLVGSPQEISFEFQASLKMQWAVGRLYFEDIEDYARYATSIAKYETKHFQPVQSRNAAVWMTSNTDDFATLMLSRSMTDDFTAPGEELGGGKLTVQYFLADDAEKPAGKEQLTEIFRGNIEGGVPAVIFTGSHGMECPSEDAATQCRLQGALVTQEWSPGVAIEADVLFTGNDVPDDAQLQGAMIFLFACFSGGCPATDTYFFEADGSPRQIAAEDRIALLPQKLLSHGALAVFGHVDQAFCYSFQNPDDTPQPQVIRTPLEFLMYGWRAGLAADKLTSVWSALSNSIGQMSPASCDPATWATLVIARDEAKNYFLLGDPAARIRVEDLL